jgi:hypothetical protein
VAAGGERDIIVRILLVILAGVYAGSYVASLAIGLTPRLPWMFFPVLAVVHLPTAFVAVRVGDAIASRFAADPGAVRLVALAVGTAIVAWARPALVWPLTILIAPAAAVAAWRGRLGPARNWLWVFPILYCGYGAVWNLNYVVAALRPDVHDAPLLALDRVLWGFVSDGPLDDGPLYPVIRSAAAIAVLQNAYMLLFGELFAVIAVLAMRGEGVARFLATTFTCYGLGLVFFAIYPVIGPCLAFFPGAFHADALRLESYGATLAMWIREYSATRAGQPTNGFGYFVGIPSLHVAMAFWLQVSLRVSRAHFWMFLPINLLMTAATFLLGYHYVVDAPAGVVLVLIVLGVRAWLEAPARPAAGR